MAGIATLGWDADANTATVSLDGTNGDNVNEGYRMVRCAMRDRVEDEPEKMLRFLASAFRLMGYEVRIVGDIDDGETN